MARRSRPGRSSARRRVPAIGGLDPGAPPVLVVGLGNPGRKYESTRHNAGFMVADRLLRGASLVARGKWSAGELSLVETASRQFLILKPSTYMNDSGRAVAQVSERYRLDPERIIVIHDDIDIPLGDVRVKKGGGTGGHRGLDSLVEEVGEAGFTRVRVGVGRPQEGIDPADYVLTDFPEDELQAAEAAVGDAAHAVLDLLADAGREDA